MCQLSHGGVPAEADRTPVSAKSITAGSVPAIRLNTVFAAWAPKGPAAWQLIECGARIDEGDVDVRAHAEVVAASAPE